MQINKSGEAIVKERNILGKGGTAGAEQAQRESFQDSLVKNLYRESAAGTDAAKSAGTDMAKSPAGRAASAGKELSIGPTENLTIREPQEGKPGGAVDAPFRGLKYEECDKIEIQVPEGRVLKFKADVPPEDGKGGVYVEAKYEDGRVESYILEPRILKNESGNHILQTGLQVMEEKER